MGGRVRPIGEAGFPSGEGKRVRCWNCRRGFEVVHTVARAPCPECGSPVAVHRLRMPMMPSGVGPKTEDRGVLRLQEAVGMAGTDHESRRTDPGGFRLERMPVPQDGEEAPRREERTAPAAPERRPFESRRRIEQIREEHFREADLARPGEPEGPATGVRRRWALVISGVMLVGLIVLLAVVIARWSG